MSNIKMIAIDLGCTLLTDDNLVTQDNKKAIKYAKEKGIIIVLATARMYSSTKYISNVINADYGVFGNGMQIMNLHNKKIIFERKIKNELVEKIIDYARTNKLYIHIESECEEASEEYDYFAKKHFLLNQNYEENLKTNIKLVADIKKYTKNKNIIKVVLASQNNMDKHVNNILKLGEGKIFLNEYSKNIYEEIIGEKYNYIEFGSTKATKATGIHYLAIETKTPKEQIMAIGDLDNDIDLLKTVGYPVVMQNAKNNVKEYASYVTKKNNNNSGVAEAIYNMLGEKE